jgi:hypothetical protein
VARWRHLAERCPFTVRFSDGVTVGGTSLSSIGMLRSAAVACGIVGAWRPGASYTHVRLTVGASACEPRLDHSEFSRANRRRPNQAEINSIIPLRNDERADLRGDRNGNVQD